MFTGFHLATKRIVMMSIAFSETVRSESSFAIRHPMLRIVNFQFSFVIHISTLSAFPKRNGQNWKNYYQEGSSPDGYVISTLPELVYGLFHILQLMFYQL